MLWEFFLRSKNEKKSSSGGMRLISVVAFVLSVAMVRKVKPENFSRCKEAHFCADAHSELLFAKQKEIFGGHLFCLPCKKKNNLE